MQLYKWVEFFSKIEIKSQFFLLKNSLNDALSDADKARKICFSN